MQNAYDMRRYKKSFAALVDAIDAAQRGDWRACVDSYELSFNLSGGHRSMFKNRYYVVSGFTATLCDGACEPTKNDYKLIESIVDDENERPEIRAKAAFTKGVLRYDKGDRNGAARAHRKCIAIVDAASQAARDREIFIGNRVNARGQPEHDMQPAGVVMDRTRANAYNNVSDRRVARVDGDVDLDRVVDDLMIQRETARMRAHGGGVISNERSQHVAFRADPDLMRERGVTGDEYNDRLEPICASCYRCGSRAGCAERYPSCAACGLVAYCGKPCQRADWAARHKAECRPKKELRRGDMVQLPPTREGEGGTEDARVTPVGFVAGDVADGTVAVEIRRGETVECEVEKLRRLPPRAPPPPPCA